MLFFFRPYYELKAQFNQMLEIQKTKVQRLEAQVSTSKLTYADALRNLEQISDEIHRSRSKSLIINANVVSTKSSNNDSSTSISEDLSDTSDEFKGIINIVWETWYYVIILLVCGKKNLILTIIQVNFASRCWIHKYRTYGRK